MLTAYTIGREYKGLHLDLYGDISNFDYWRTMIYLNKDEAEYKTSIIHLLGDVSVKAIPFKFSKQQIFQNILARQYLRWSKQTTKLSNTQRMVISGMYWKEEEPFDTKMHKILAAGDRR